MRCCSRGAAFPVRRNVRVVCEHDLSSNGTPACACGRPPCSERLAVRYTYFRLIARLRKTITERKRTKLEVARLGRHLAGGACED